MLDSTILFWFYSKLQENFEPDTKYRPKYLVSETHLIVVSQVANAQQLSFQPLPILIATDFSKFSFKSNKANSSQQIWIIFCNSLIEGVSKIISAYISAPTDKPNNLQPKWLSLINKSSTYSANNDGLRTPPCLIPASSLKGSDKALPQRTQLDDKLYQFNSNSMTLLSFYVSSIS